MSRISGARATETWGKTHRFGYNRFGRFVAHETAVVTHIVNSFSSLDRLSVVAVSMFVSPRRQINFSE